MSAIENLPLLWPTGAPVSAAFDANVGPAEMVYPGADRATVYVASPHSPFLAGFRADRATGRLREFGRVNLGFERGGTAAVAAGGRWVFAAGAGAARLVVLRVQPDLYQNRIRLLVVHVVDSQGRPELVTTSRDGKLVCVLCRASETVTYFQCRGSGRLSALDRQRIASNAVAITIDEADRSLRIAHSDVGFSRIGLESIFEKIEEAGTVRA